MQSGMMLHDMEPNLLNYIESFLNPRPIGSVQFLPESYPVLTDAHVNYNVVMARKLHVPSQLPYSFTSLASVMHNQDIESGRA